MARRYGGKYSPSGDAGEGAQELQERGHYERAQVSPAGARANILFVPAIPLVFTTLNDGAIAMTLGLIGAGLLTLAAFLLRGGLEAEAEYNSRRVARRPAIPRKIFASLLTGLGVGTATLAHDGALLAAALYAVASGGLHIASFGLDPLKDKGMEGIDTFQQDRVARVVDEAEKHLQSMRDAVLRAGDRTAEARLERFTATVRDMVRTVEEDPRDLTSARKYLGVYLMGARDASIKFADLYSRSRDPEARKKYIALLDDLDSNFVAKTKDLMADTHTDLDVEIEVLRDRLAQEGVVIDNNDKEKT
jgi:hypothetical protein